MYVCMYVCLWHFNENPAGFVIKTGSNIQSIFRCNDFLTTQISLYVSETTVHTMQKLILTLSGAVKGYENLTTSTTCIQIDVYSTCILTVARRSLAAAPGDRSTFNSHSSLDNVGTSCPYFRTHPPPKPLWKRTPGDHLGTLFFSVVGGYLQWPRIWATSDVRENITDLNNYVYSATGDRLVCTFACMDVWMDVCLGTVL